MAVTLRLMRFGKKGHAQYRIVAVDKRKPRNGSYIEAIGVYDPHIEQPVQIKKDRLSFWQEKGALVSEGFERLLKNKKAIKMV